MFSKIKWIRWTEQNRNNPSLGHDYDLQLPNNEICVLNSLLDVVLSQGFRHFDFGFTSSTTISHLNLAARNLVTLPDSICSLHNLESLSLSRNLLVQIPASIGKLSKLTIIDLSENYLELLPDS